MVTDASVKNNIASSIVHIHVHNKPIVKMLHHAINIMSTEAEFFTIRCGINQASHLQNISKIIVVTNSIYTAKKIFDPSSHPLQKQVALILNDLRDFFNCHYENIVEFCKCPSKSKWNLHKYVDIENKSFNLILLLPAKNSWDFSKKSECNNIISNQKMTFQASDLKGNNFLELVDSDNKILEPLYSKDRTQLQYVCHSNTLYVRVTRAITNHAPISEYHLCFFLREDFSCLCSLYPIETRYHILHECSRFNEYWNPRRNLIAHFILFWILIQVCLPFALHHLVSQIQITLLETCFLGFFFTLLFPFSFSFLFLLHVVSVVMYVVTKQLPQSAYAPHVINC